MLSLCLLGLTLSGGDPRGGPDVVPERADGWATLDAHLAALGAPEGVAPFQWGLLVRAFFTASEKEADVGTTDVSGFDLEDVDLWAGFADGDLAWRLSADVADGAMRLEDAYAAWHLTGELFLVGGQFKPRVVRSGSIPESELFFRERSFLGAAFDLWDVGVGLAGHYDQYDYWLSLADGANGDEADPFWSARVEWALFDAAFDDGESPRGAPNHLRVLFGASTFADAGQSSGDAGGYGLDLALTFGPYAFQAEWADLGDEFARPIDVFNGYEITLGDGQPRGGTLSRALGESAEAAVRFQQADDADRTRAVDLGLAWCPGGARFLADVAFVDGDTRDFSIVSLGVQLGTSGRPRPFLLEEGGR